jgi:hypothetical protein
MEIKTFVEPRLQFGTDEHICPKSGIWTFNPYDANSVRPEKIKLGIIGRGDSVDKILGWIDKCKTYISAKDSKQPNLYPGFCGFNKDIGFKSEVIYDEGYIRRINNSDFENITKESNYLPTIISEIVDLYVSEIKFLSKNKKPDVILCVLTEKLFETITGSTISVKDQENEDDEEAVSEEENNFRRMLKAAAMAHNIPIQIIRDRLANPTSDMQDASTTAWNFFTALYYKASGTPWALIKNASSVVCYAGISFFKSRDKSTIQTSVTQIFNEHGKGVILRGSPITMRKGDKEPHLSEDQAYELLDNSLNEYYEALKIFPKRLVIHKSSNYNKAEIDGFQSAAYKNKINAVDLVTIMSSPLRLYSNNNYPPLRGTLASFDEKTHLLYTRGFVEYYNTYPGSYIPSPVEIRLYANDESPDVICQEILALTKMNWNSAQFDKKLPITIECSQRVGEIMKYLSVSEVPQIRYSFYM